VFARWRAASDCGRVLTEAGGRLVYEADVSINGGDGRLAVFGFERHPEPVVDDLEKAFGAPFRRAGADSATARIESAGREIRLIAVALEDPNRTLVFALDQGAAEARRSRSAASFPDLDGVPPYPGAEPDTVMVNRETQTTLVIAETGAGPDAVRAFYDSALRAAGWNPAFPDTAGPGDRMAVYARGPRVCCVFAAQVAGSPRTQITVLHKKLAVK